GILINIRRRIAAATLLDLAPFLGSTRIRPVPARISWLAGVWTPLRYCTMTSPRQRPKSPPPAPCRNGERATMAALPAGMQVVQIAAPGGPEVLRLGERPVPTPARGEVLIKVAAAGVNRPDVEQRRGTYPPPSGASDIPGLEIAGTVVALGP